MTYISKGDHQREDWLFLLKQTLEFALVEFQLLQPLTEGPSPELPPALFLAK